MHRALGHNVSAKSAPTFTEGSVAKVSIAQRTVQRSISAPAS
jgi:hypothetical protein